MQQLRTAPRRTCQLPARLLRLGAVLFAGLAIFGTACERASNNGTLPLLTSTTGVRRLALADAKRRYPVRLRGIATYYHAPSNYLILQSAAAGILADTTRTQDPSEPGRELEIVGGHG